MSRTPTSPVSAHHRLMRNLVATSLKGYKPTPEELDRVGRVFQKAGGSWVDAFLGSADAIALLRQVIRVAAKNDLLSKSPKWS